MSSAANATSAAERSLAIERRLGFRPQSDTCLGVVLGGSRFEAQSSVRYTLDMLDLDACELLPTQELAELPLAARAGAATPGLRRLELGFLPHGMAINPRQPSRCLWFEKWGPGAAYLDLSQGLLLATLAPLSGHQFYGHGSFSQDAAFAFCVETKLETGAGVISVRDASPGAQFRAVGEFPSHGHKPHDCVLLPAEDVLVVSNGGGAFGSSALGSVCFIEASSGKLLERLEVTDARRNAGHVALDDARNLALVSAPRDGLPETDPGGLSLRLRDQSLRQLNEPREVCGRMLGESLSVCIDSARDRVWVTNPKGSLISVWRLSTGENVGELSFASARGVALSLDESVVCSSNGPRAELTLIDPVSLSLSASQPAALRVFGGSHLYLWAQPNPRALDN